MAEDDAGRGGYDEGMEKSPVRSCPFAIQGELWYMSHSPSLCAFPRWLLHVESFQGGNICWLLQGFGGFGACSFPTECEFCWK